MRYVYVVTTKGGYQGTKRFNYNDGTYMLEGVPFATARLYAREQDAAAAAGIIRGARVARARVVEE